MKYRKHTWLNTKTMEPEYGIQTKHPETGKWMHCCEGKKPLIYTAEKARDAKLRDLRYNAKAHALATNEL
jgi:hypothetical protein